MNYKVNFSSHGKTVSLEAGKTILDAAAAVGIPLESNCGSTGKCGKCKVRIAQGYAPQEPAAGTRFFTAEESAEGWVLGCKYEIKNDLTVEVPIQFDAGNRKLQLNSLLEDLVINSPVKKVYIEMEKPTIKDQCPDYERILRTLDIDAATQKPSRGLLQAIPKTIRDANFKITAVLHGSDLMWVEAGDTTAEKYGVVFDIGTTTVVALLINLNDGSISGAAAETNPQNVFGADVISRINYAMTNEGGLEHLHNKVLESANNLALRAAAEAGVAASMIYEATVVGNTTMNELFTGVDPKYLAPAPFIPAYVHGIEISGRELGFELNPEAKINILPNIAGYVGADTMGVILGTHIHERPDYSLAIDVGTNGEIVLAGNNRILACSTAAGPAFEGAEIKFGMRAAEGAIEDVYIDNATGSVHINVIGNKKASGICGSGLLDAVAQLYDEGILNFKGAFNAEGDEAYEKIHPALKERIRKADVGYEFVLTTAEESVKGIPITICQKDVREMQMAKGAIFAGMRVLMNEMQITIEDVRELMVAGAFGSYIKPESALSIGLFPGLPNGEILSIGNAASEGGRLALVSEEERALCGELARKSEYIELSSRLDFQDEYVMALYFPVK